MCAVPYFPLGRLVIGAEDADLDDETSTDDDVFSTIVLNGTAQCMHFGDRQRRSHVNTGGDQHGQVNA